MRLPFRLADRSHHDRRLLRLRLALVRRRHRLVHQPRQVIDEGVRVLGPRREAAILGDQVHFVKLFHAKMTLAPDKLAYIISPDRIHRFKK